MRPTVRVAQQGRSGHVVYQEGQHTITGYQEFGGGDVVAIVSMGGVGEWRAAHGWAVDRRVDILHVIASELIRQHAPDCRADIDEVSGDIVFTSGGLSAGLVATARVAPAAGPGTPAEQSAAWVRRYYDLRGRLGTIGLIAVALIGAALWVKTRVLVTQPGPGVPIDRTVRTDTHLATLIARTQPYPVSLHHDPSIERHTLSVLLVPLDGGAPRLVPLFRDLEPGSDRLAHVLGSDGQTVWVTAATLAGAHLRTGRTVTEQDVLQASPGLDPRWLRESRGAAIVDGRVLLLNDDHSAAMAIDPLTLRAESVAPKVRPGWPDAPPLTRYMAAGLIRPDGTWLGLQSDADLAGAYKAGQWLRAVESTTDTPRDTRRLMRGEFVPLDTGDDASHRRIRTMAPIADTGFHNAAFLRLADDVPPLRHADPDSVLMLHTSGDGIAAGTTLLVSRVAVADGRLTWTTDTGIHRFALTQILPGEQSTAFVGERPPVPGKVSEPLLVILDHVTGTLATHSLWR
jgi:hypothetical protein